MLRQCLPRGGGIPDLKDNCTATPSCRFDRPGIALRRRLRAGPAGVAVARLTEQATDVIQIPSTCRNVVTSFGSSVLTRTAICALAARWSSRSFGSQPSLQAFVRFDSQRMVPQTVPEASRTVWTTSPPWTPLPTGDLIERELLAEQFFEADFNIPRPEAAASPVQIFASDLRSVPACH